MEGCGGDENMGGKENDETQFFYFWFDMRRQGYTRSLNSFQVRFYISCVHGLILVGLYLRASHMFGAVRSGWS